MKIIGKSECTPYQMAQYLVSKNPSSKSWALKYAQIYIDEGEIEGVRGDAAWIQSCIETGYFTFNGGTAVTFSQNNFCGLGVTRKGVKGLSFDSPRLGIRAQIQHLKGYATSQSLKKTCVDPRYKYINPKGKASTFEELAGKWAVPGYDITKASSLEDAMNKKIGYGFSIINGVAEMKKIIDITQQEFQKYYRVQTGAFTSKSNAEKLQMKLKKDDFYSVVKKENNLYKCQLGAFTSKTNAEKLLNKVRAKGYDAFVNYC